MSRLNLMTLYMIQIVFKTLIIFLFSVGKKNLWTGAGLTGASGANVQQRATGVCRQDKGCVTSPSRCMEERTVQVLVTRHEHVLTGAVQV